MAIIDDAILPEHLKTIKIIKSCGLGLAVIVQFYIAMITYSKIRSTQTVKPQFAKRREIPILFFLSFLFSLSFSIGAFISNFMFVLYGSHDAINAATVTVPFFYFFFMITLLCTLVTRLYITFQGSALRMSKTMIYVFILLFVLLLISTFVVCIAHALIVYDHGTDFLNQIMFLAAALLYILYMVGCALSVRLFVGNLSKITKMTRGSLAETPQTPTVSKGGVSPKANDTTLNSKQLNLLHLSAKYILLFFVAITSSILTYVLITALSFESRGMMMSFDLSINLFCLYLQFAFAKKHYVGCCGCLDSRCRSIVLKRARKGMQGEPAMQMTLSVVESVSPTSVSTVSTSEMNDVVASQDETEMEQNI